MTNYSYDAASRLSGLTQDVGGSAQDLSLGFSYNPAGQIASRTSSNDAYRWGGAVNVDRSYAANGLNQYTQSGAVTPTYDARGNLTQAGGQSYAYNTRNQLFATGTAGQLFYRNPAGLLNHIIASSGGAVTNLDYVGSELATEASSTVLRRYVYGPGVDKPLVWYEGAGTTDRRYLHADERGSIIAVSDNAGNATAINTYDEYGIPGSGNIGRFQYTGQKWISELGMYDYKARMYSPTLGRFLQTDPIGYGDGMNWYGYVGGDPVNFVDPSGLYCTDGSSGDSASDCAKHGGLVSGTPFEYPADIEVNGRLDECRQTIGCTSYSTIDNHIIIQIPGIGPEDITAMGDIVVVAPSPQNTQPVCPPGPRANLGGGVSATGFLGILGVSGGLGVNVSVPTASLSNFSLRGIQVSFSGSITPLAGIGLFLGAGPSYSAGGSSGPSRNISGSITPTAQLGAGDGAGVEVGTDFTSPTSASVAAGRIAGGAYGAVGARFSGTVATNPIGCR